MTTPLSPGSIPSERQALLKQLEGQRITQMIRYSEFSIEHLKHDRLGLKIWWS